MSEAEETFAAQLRAVGIPHTRQAKWCSGRRFRADFALTEHGILVEVQGGAWSGGRHTRGAGYAADCVRMGKAVALGWTMLYVTPQQVTSGEALAMVEAAMRRPERPELPAEPVKRPRRGRQAAEGATAPMGK